MMDEELDDTGAVHTDALMDIVRSMLDGHGYAYQLLDAHTLHLTLRNKRGLYTFYFTADESRDFLRILGNYGPYVPTDRRAAIAEALTRINARSAIGNFDLDFTDGEIRFRASVDVEEGLLSGKMVDNMLGFTMNALERFHDPLMRIAFGDVEPELAL
ncbi:MAG: hypothetical protein DMD35_19975, partial [Gemmatimonadetes bacterium]